MSTIKTLQSELRLTDEEMRKEIINESAQLSRMMTGEQLQEMAESTNHELKVISTEHMIDVMSGWSTEDVIDYTLNGDIIVNHPYARLPEKNSGIAETYENLSDAYNEHEGQSVFEDYFESVSDLDEMPDVAQEIYNYLSPNEGD